MSESADIGPTYNRIMMGLSASQEERRQRSAETGWEAASAAIPALGARAAALKEF